MDHNDKIKHDMTIHMPQLGALVINLQSKNATTS